MQNNISARISGQDCEGEIESESMKGASGQTADELDIFGSLLFRSAEQPGRASPVASESDSWHEPTSEDRA